MTYLLGTGEASASCLAGWAVPRPGRAGVLRASHAQLSPQKKNQECERGCVTWVGLPGPLAQAMAGGGVGSEEIRGLGRGSMGQRGGNSLWWAQGRDCVSRCHRL